MSSPPSPAVVDHTVRQFVPSVDTWVQWRVTVDLPEGDHTVRVRAIGKDGETQTDVVRSPDPDGSTGLHTIEVSAG